MIHVEVQGYTDPDFARRMFQYYYRILDKYDKPIAAFAIFVDASKSFHPKYYKSEFLGTKITYVFNTYKIIDHEDAELEASNNPFAMAMLSAKLALTRKPLKDEQLFDLAYDLVKRLLTKKMSKEKIRQVMNFLRYYLDFENTEMKAKFTKAIAMLTERNTTMGIEEFLLDQAEKKGIKKGIEKGIEKGRKENTRETALKMKKSGLDITLIADITGLTVEEIEKLL